jgi:hypothetical protein
VYVCGMDRTSERTNMAHFTVAIATDEFYLFVPRPDGTNTRSFVDNIGLVFRPLAPDAWSPTAHTVPA